MILDGNEDKIFSISRGENNEGVISLANRIDREFSGAHLITIKCFKPYERSLKSKQKRYDSSKMDEIQVKIVVVDLDDNSPKFVDHNMTIGVRVNAPIYTQIATLKAIDPDADANPVHYSIHNVTYLKPR